MKCLEYGFCQISVTKSNYEDMFGTRIFTDTVMIGIIILTILASWTPERLVSTQTAPTLLIKESHSHRHAQPRLY